MIEVRLPLTHLYTLPPRPGAEPPLITKRTHFPPRTSSFASVIQCSVDRYIDILRAVTRYYGLDFDPPVVRTLGALRRDLLLYGVDCPSFRRHCREGSLRERGHQLAVPPAGHASDAVQAELRQQGMALSGVWDTEEAN